MLTENVKKLLLSLVEGSRAELKEIHTFANMIFAESDRLGLSGIYRGKPGQWPVRQTINCYDELLGKSVLEVSEKLIKSPSGFDNSVGAAVIDSAMLLESNPFEANAIMCMKKLCQSRKTCFIGHFPPAAVWREKGMDVTIIELIPKKAGDVRWEDADKSLSEAEVVFITGLTILNGTLEQVIEKSSNAIYRIMLGPSSIMSSKFFDLGLHMVGGSLVNNRDIALGYWQRGGCGMRFAPEGALSTRCIAVPELRKELGL